jgi:hypothetical protein
MKNETTTPGSSFNLFVKLFAQVIKTLFKSNNNNEFKRLKDFIGS